MKIPLTALAIALSFAQASFGAECICDKVPMYNNGPGSCYHYAIVYTVGTPCTQLYATGHIDQCASGENCDGLGGNCSPLPAESPTIRDFFFDAPLKSESELTSPHDFRNYLEDELGEESGFYRLWDFELIGTVELNRRDEADAFHAIIFEMKQNTGGRFAPRAYIGVEISSNEITGAERCNRWNAVATTRASGTAVHNPVNGILEVEVPQGGVAFVRLNRDTNAGITYPPAVKP